MERAVTTHDEAGVTLKVYAPAESVWATANPPDPSIASTNAPETPVPESATVPEIVRVAVRSETSGAAVSPETVTLTGSARMYPGLSARSW